MRPAAAVSGAGVRGRGAAGRPHRPPAPRSQRCLGLTQGWNGDHAEGGWGCACSHWGTTHGPPLAGTPKLRTPCRLPWAWSPRPTGDGAPKWCQPLTPRPGWGFIGLLCVGGGGGSLRGTAWPWDPRDPWSRVRRGLRLPQGQRALYGRLSPWACGSDSWGSQGAAHREPGLAPRGRVRWGEPWLPAAARSRGPLPPVCV